MNATIRRRLARLFYEHGPVCFACTRRGPTPCPGHEWGGTIIQWRTRRWVRAARVPSRLYDRVDCRWTLR